MFFLPLFDNNPTARLPLISWLLLGLCVCVFFWQQSLGPDGQTIALLQFGFIPSHFSGIAVLPADFALLPAWGTIFTSMFMHADWLHIASNMLYLWIFSDNVEDSMGSFEFILFYLTCGVAAALTQMAIDPSSQIPMVGASGAIAGVLGAYLMLHPKAAIRTFMLILIFIRFINLPAWLVLGVWIAGQFVAVPNALQGSEGGVAYFAHIGGFIAGMVLILPFKRRDVALFGRNDPTPQQWNAEPMRFEALKSAARQRYRRTSSRHPLGSRRFDPEVKSANQPDTAKHRSSVPRFTQQRRKKRPPGPWD